MTAVNEKGGVLNFNDIDVIYNEDCNLGLDRIRDNSIDLLVMDPPYEISVSGAGAFGSNNREYHSSLSEISHGITNDLLEKIISKMKVINAYVWCNKAQLRQYIDFFDDMDCKIDLLTWHKINPVPTCNNKYLSDTEYLLFFREKGVKLYGSYDTKRKHYESPLNTDDKEKWGHPTIKPLDIIKNIIVNSTRGGELVFDPFMGSGTTAVACLETDRHYIGFEINPDYYNTCIKRISQISKTKETKTTLDTWNILAEVTQ